MRMFRCFFIAGWVAGSIVPSASPALADGVAHQRCCTWLPEAFFPDYYPAPAYFAGPLSGATYGYYYGSYWNSHHRRHQRVRVVK